MADFSCAINLIRKYEGFSEKAYPDLSTGGEPYTIGYGTQFYPDGSPVKAGQLCSQKKALEYLFHEVEIIDTQLLKLNLGLDGYMHQALISFIHSIGWESFLYSKVIDCLENEDFPGVTEEISQWVFGPDHNVIGGLLDRRREEISLFLTGVDSPSWYRTEILLKAFRNYSGAQHEINAINVLEESINPYALAKFANDFHLSDDPWVDYPSEDFDSIFNS